MQPVNLFDLATHQAKWLSVRQSAISGNIANVNTPGYQAMEIEPFERVLDGTRVAMQGTHVDHIKTGATDDSYSLRREEDGPAQLPSGNSVVLEQELVKSGEVSRSFEMNTAIVKAFHRMMMTTTRS